MDITNDRNERWRGFLDSLLQKEDELLSALRGRAEAEDIPIIRKEAEYFLRWLLSVQRPERILEIGTAIGYSAICMLRHSPAQASLVTIENDAGRIPEAIKNFSLAGIKDRVSLIEGDAAEVLPGLEGSFDFVFLDAAKGQYIVLLPEILRLLREGGILVTDNILQDGDTLESRFAVRRRDRTIHKRMREYLYAITHDERLVTDLLPVGDGIAVSVKL
ncbi:MAG: O-methyltransferase [Lachnospiraceae bacterium]|nr:O-methyltransferase [Lachnospiraceae bacterium]